MSFALVGPAQTDVSALESCANVTLFGEVESFTALQLPCIDPAARSLA